MAANPMPQKQKQRPNAMPKKTRMPMIMPATQPPPQETLSVIIGGMTFPEVAAFVFTFETPVGLKPVTPAAATAAFSWLKNPLLLVSER